VATETKDGIDAQRRPQNKLTRLTITTAFDSPTSLVVNGCRTQFADEMTSPSITVTSKPPGCPEISIA
jgi:hypothetical protein